MRQLLAPKTGCSRCSLTVFRACATPKLDTLFICSGTWVSGLSARRAREHTAGGCNTSWTPLARSWRLAAKTSCAGCTSRLRLGQQLWHRHRPQGHEVCLHSCQSEQLLVEHFVLRLQAAHEEEAVGPPGARRCARVRDLLWDNDVGLRAMARCNSNAIWQFQEFHVMVLEAFEEER